MTEKYRFFIVTDCRLLPIPVFDTPFEQEYGSPKQNSLGRHHGVCDCLPGLDAGLRRE